MAFSTFKEKIMLKYLFTLYKVGHPQFVVVFKQMAQGDFFCLSSFFFLLPLVRSLCAAKMSVIYVTYILALGILQTAIRSPLSPLPFLSEDWEDPLLLSSTDLCLLTISWVFSTLAVEIALFHISSIETVQTLRTEVFPAPLLHLSY